MMFFGLIALVQFSTVLGNCPDDEVSSSSIATQQIPRPSLTRAYTEAAVSSTNNEPRYTDGLKESSLYTSSKYISTFQDYIPTYTEVVVTSTNSEPRYTDRLQEVSQYSSLYTSSKYISASHVHTPVNSQESKSTFASSTSTSTVHVQVTPTGLPQYPYTQNTAVNAPPECLILKDCQAWYDFGVRYSGVFSINPDNGKPFQVYCDMETDGRGWTVFQRRVDGSVYFYRGWSDYEQGFGNLTGEFWLGLSKMHRLTKSRNKQLRIDLGDFDGHFRYANYSSFSVGNSTTDYTLSLSGYSGNAGDSLSTVSGMRFSTKDRDNDVSSGSCAIGYSGAWWYANCHASNLNGLYLRGSHISYADGVEWNTWTGHYYSLRFTEMKLA